MSLRRTAMFWFFLYLTSFHGISLGATPQVEVVVETAKVKVDQATIAVATKGQKYRLLKAQGAWVAIQIGDGENAKRGWILASAVRRLADPEINEDSAAPSAPLDASVSIDLTQFSPGWGAQSAMYFKIRVSNESSEPIEFKVAELQLKVDDQPLPSLQQTNFNGYPVFTEASMQIQMQVSQLRFLKDTKLDAGSSIDGWLGFNVGSLQQALVNPNGVSDKSWILDGKIGSHPIRIDLKENERLLIAEKSRPSNLDPSVQVIEIGSRINALNASRLMDVLRAIPAGDCGCVLVLTQKECLFDGLATQHIQQQLFQLFNAGNPPVVSFEREMPLNQGFGYQSMFHNGQMANVTSEAAGVLTILGRRPNTGEALIKHLGHATSGIRAAAARALTQHLAEANVIKALVTAAADAEATVRAAATGALGGGNQQPSGMRQNGSMDTVAVIKAMTDPESSVRLVAAQTAGVFPCEDVRAAVIKLLDDADFSVKLASITSVGTLEAKDAIPKLKTLRNDQNPPIKTAAIDALIKTGELTPLAGAMAKLEGGTLQDPDFTAIGKAKEKLAVEPLIARLMMQNNYQTNLVARTLGEIHDMRAVEPLIQTFVHGNRNMHGMEELPRALGKLGDRRAVEPLRQVLQIPNQHFQPQMRAAIFEALLVLKAPQVFDDVNREIQKCAAANQFFQISPMLLALGQSRDAKAIPIIEPFLANQQTAIAAAQALWQLGTKAAHSALENRLTAANFPNSQMVILNQKWPKSAAAAAFLRRVSQGENRNSRTAAEQVLNNLQANVTTGQGADLPMPIGYFAPSIEAENAVEEWIDGNAPTDANLRGKVLAIFLPDTSGAAPELPVEINELNAKFGKQGLVVLALWKSAGWDWDAEAKQMIIRPDATAEQERRAVAALTNSRGIKYRAGLISATSGLAEKFGGPSGARVAIVDRAGILQSVRSVDETDMRVVEFEPLISELLAEPPPSATVIRVSRQIPPPPDLPKLPRSAMLAYTASSFDPAGESWTIPAHHDTIWSVKFAPDGKTIASTSEDGTARIWDLATGKLNHTLSGHVGVVRHCAFIGDGARLLTSGFDRTIRVWNVTKGELEKSLTDDAPAYFLSPLDDGQTLISASQDARLRYWNLAEGKLHGYLDGHSASVWTVASVTVKGKHTTIASGSVDRTVKIWDFPSGDVRQTLSGHTSGVNAVAISANAQTVASGGNEVILWDVDTGKEKLRIPDEGSFVYDVEFSPDQKALAVGRGNHTVSLYNVTTGELMRRWNRGGWCVHFSKDGRRLATGCDDRTIRIWNVTSTNLAPSESSTTKPGP